MYKNWEQQTQPAIYTVWNLATYDIQSAVQAPWGSFMTLITKKLQQKQCLWFWSSRTLPTPLSLYHSHKKSLPSLWWLSDFFRCTPTNIWLQAVRTACHAAIRPHFDSVSTPAEIFRNLPHSWPQMKHITQLRVKMKQCWDWFLDLLSEMCRVESHDLVLSQRWVTNLVTWYLIQQNRK